MIRPEFNHKTQIAIDSEESILGDLFIAVPCKVGCHGKALFNPPLVWSKMQIQSSVSKGALKITTEIERDITNDPGMRSDYNSKPAFNE